VQVQILRTPKLNRRGETSGTVIEDFSEIITARAEVRFAKQKESM